MKKASAVVAILVACSVATHSHAQIEKLVDKFERRSHTSDLLTLPYRLFVPEDLDPSVQYPLVITLHGSGERGFDNQIHIDLYGLATSWAEPMNQSRWPAFVVSPQAPPGGTWSTASIHGGTKLGDISDEIYTVMSLLDSLEIEFNIDPDRIYITGLSMGGSGTFDIAARFAERFAAAIPMSGGYSGKLANLYDGLPIWIFHGERDGVVPVSWSRNMIDGLLDEGREVLFTDCGLIATACAPISDAVFQMAADAHTDVIYTGYPSGLHEIWPESYDDPRLMPWVFSQHRLRRDAIQFTSPVDYPTWAGTQSIEWNVTASEEMGELWFSADNGETWVEMDSAITNSGIIEFDTGTLDGTPFARIRLVFYDADGFVHKKEDSDPFVIDGPGNGAPVLRIDHRPFRLSPEIEREEFDLMVLASDPELQTLEASVYYSVDAGKTFGLVQTLPLEPSGTRQPIRVDLSSLPNSKTAMLRVELSDGELMAEDQTIQFVKTTPRKSTSFVEQVAGNGLADIRINWVDQGALTGHRYRITFNDNRPSANAYDVADLETGQLVLENIPVSDGLAESPAFDGMRLVVEVLDRTQVDLDLTGWATGGSNLEVSISAPTVQRPSGPIVLLATPADYVMTIFESVVDTSSTELGFQPMEMRFTVENDKTGRVEIMFSDKNADGWPSPGDFFFILEPEMDSGPLKLAWFLRFSGDENTVLPAAGNEFLFRTIKPTTDGDVFEFDAVVGLAAEDDEIPEAIVLLSNYPNPFSNSTIIEYRLSSPSEVELIVFDVLGRSARRLDNGTKPAGLSRTVWDARSTAGQTLPPGVYFYRLSATDARTGTRVVATQKMTIMR